MYKWLFILDTFWSDESNKYNIYRFKSRFKSLTNQHILCNPYLKITDQSNRTYEFSPYWHVNMIENGLGYCKFCEALLQNFIQHFFKIVLYWCLDLILHNIGTKLKLNKYILDISIPFCHHFYLSATLKQCFTEFAIT
jgi:hypothetical protein